MEVQHLTGRPLPPIPVLPSELAVPIHALLECAVLFRSAFCASADGTPLCELSEETVDGLQLADRVVDTWQHHFAVRDREVEPPPQACEAPCEQAEKPPFHNIDAAGCITTYYYGAPPRHRRRRKP